MLSRGKVILFYPAYDGPPLGRSALPARACFHSAPGQL